MPRTESDAFGPLEVDDSVLWGAQTQRSLINFPIGGPAARKPLPIIHAGDRDSGGFFS